MASETSHLLDRTTENDNGANCTTRAPDIPAPQGPDETQVLGSVPPVPLAMLKTQVTAYLMWFPFGVFGFHHFYLKNISIGFNYMFTFGLFGFGWLVDFWRIPMLVNAANMEIEAKWIWEHENCETSTQDPMPKFKYSKPKRLSDCYILGFTTGFLGFHHHYLGRHYLGLLYMFTFGLFSVGFLTDWIRMPIHLKRYNERQAKKQQGVKEHRKYYLDDAYILAISGGIFGFHHFYLDRYIWGFFYMFTLGVLGFGWLADLMRLPFLVEDANHRAKSRLSPLDGVEEGVKYRSTEDDAPRIDPYYSDYNSGQSHLSYSQSDTPSAPVSQRSSIAQQSVSPRSIPKTQHFKEFKPDTEAVATSSLLPDHTVIQPHHPSGTMSPPPPYAPMADSGSAMPNGETPEPCSL